MAPNLLLLNSPLFTTPGLLAPSFERLSAAGASLDSLQGNITDSWLESPSLALARNSFMEGFWGNQTALDLPNTLFRNAAAESDAESSLVNDMVGGSHWGGTSDDRSWSPIPPLGSSDQLGSNGLDSPLFTPNRSNFGSAENPLFPTSTFITPGLELTGSASAHLQGQSSTQLTNMASGASGGGGSLG
jgi:hypothetical protein